MDVVLGGEGAVVDRAVLRGGGIGRPKVRDHDLVVVGDEDILIRDPTMGKLTAVGELQRIEHRKQEHLEGFRVGTASQCREALAQVLATGNVSHHIELVLVLEPAPGAGDVWVG